MMKKWNFLLRQKGWKKVDAGSAPGTTPLNVVVKACYVRKKNPFFSSTFFDKYRLYFDAKINPIVEQIR